MRILFALSLGMMVAVTVPASAALFNYAPGDNAVRFEDDFSNNANGWAFTTGSTGSQIANTGPSGQGEWGPVTSSTGTNQTATYTFPVAVNMTTANGTSVYFRIRTDNVTSSYSGNAQVEIDMQSSAAFARAWICPGANTMGLGRYGTTHGITPNDNYSPAVNQTFANTSTYVDFRTAYRLDTATDVLTVDLYRYSSGTWVYQGSSGGPASNFYWYDSGLIGKLLIGTRNITGAVHFDAIAVAQNVPEPTGLALIGMGTLAFLARRRCL